MEKHSERLNRMSFSQTFVMSNKVREMKASGLDVISLTLGEPDFDVPKNIKEAFAWRTVSYFDVQKLERRQTAINILKEQKKYIIKQGLY